MRDDHFDEAYMSVAQLIDYYNFLHFPNGKILQTKQYVRMTLIGMYHRKRSCLIKPFDTQINSYMSAGLIGFWGKLFKAPNHDDNNEQIEPKALSLNQINGVITACAFLICVSVIIFLLELISPHNMAIKKILDFFTLNTA